MTTLADFREMVRRSILKDDTPDEETNEFRWTNAEIRDYIWWAIDQFAAHTAVATGVTYEATGVEYALPDNLYAAEQPDVTLRVWLEHTNGTIEYLNPVRFTPELYEMTSSGFYTRPHEVLWLTDEPESGDTLHVEYYAYYNKPYADSDVITVPRWSIAAISYLVGVHALSNVALKTALIRRWNQRQDSGNPDHNSPQHQQKQFLKMYEDELRRYRPQDRVNNYRSV